MIDRFRFFRPTLALCLLAATISGCGGAPGVDSDSDTDADTEDGNIVNFSGIPTSISLGFAFSTSATADTVGTEAGASILLANVVGNEAFDGQVVEFVTSNGIIEDACFVDEAGCSVTWTSASESVRPGNISGTTVILAIVPNASEPFVDENGNGLYDIGEQFDIANDYPEPFLDANNSGTWEVGEFFFDQNGDTIWNDANGVWDGPCSFTTDDTCVTTNGIAIFDQNIFPLLRSDGSIANRDQFCTGTYSSSIIEELCTEEVDQ